MKCIDDLFDWILEDIFKRLPRDSRLICKEVCQRWLEILMTRAVFREDRQIYFVEHHKNRITPYATISNAKYDYEMTIYIGRSIKKVKYKATSDLFNTFYHMPQIKELKFGTRFRLTTEYMKRFHREKSPFLPNLKSIELDRFDSDDSEYGDSEDDEKDDDYSICDCDESSSDKYFSESHDDYSSSESSKNSDCYCYNTDNKPDTAAKLRKSIPDDTQIKIKKYAISEKNIGEFDWIVENLAPEEIHVELWRDHPSELCHKVLSIEKFPDKKVCFTFLDSRGCTTKPHFVYLDAFLEKHSNIKSVEIFSDFAPFPKPYTQITKLRLDQNREIPQTTLKLLENLENLEHLEIDVGSGQCTVGHENIHLPKLKCLKIMESNEDASIIQCADCAKILTSSFPLMEEFLGDFDFPGCGSILRLMLKNWPKLKSLRFTITNYNESENVENFIIDFKERLSLRDLEIHSFDQDASGDDLQEIIKVFPNLRSLSLYFKQIKNCIALLQAVLQGLPKLKSLSMGGFSKCDLDMKESIINIIENHGRSLQRLDVPVI